MAPSTLSSSLMDTTLDDVKVKIEHDEEEAVKVMSEPLTMLGAMAQPPARSDVLVVGAGPTGTLLAAVLTRFGVKVDLIDERAEKTSFGRADGLQPKTIETLKMLRLGDELLRVGVKVFDICMWKAGKGEELRRIGRQAHYPQVAVDVLDPFLLLCHQGMVEGVFIEDLRRRGVELKRCHQFESYSMPAETGPLKVNCRWNVTHEPKTMYADYLVGCDGAHSRVRKSIPDTFSVGTMQNSIWGVLDGELDTDFPDLWSKTVVHNEEHGSILMVPRERNMTRLYIEMKSSAMAQGLGQEYVMRRAQQILAPFRIRWRHVEWFGRYQVSQRVAPRFTDPHGRAFIAGDASHTHSPKSAQGMNTSMHDAWNLAWKLNLAVRGLARPLLLETYEEERKKIAHDLIDFDYEHENRLAGGDVAALAENFRTNVRFISGVGVEYGENVLNQGYGNALGAARPGCNLPVAKVSRYVDSNPVDIQLDVPILGQFKIYVFVPDVRSEAGIRFLNSLGSQVALETSPILRLSVAAYQSYLHKPRRPSQEDIFIRPERYTRLSHLFAFALITSTPKTEFELSSLPLIFTESKWSIYVDDVPSLDTLALHCTEKWLGTMLPGQVAIVNVRPDNYVGSINRWDATSEHAGSEAARWLESYYSSFLNVP